MVQKHCLPCPVPISRFPPVPCRCQTSRFVPPCRRPASAPRCLPGGGRPAERPAPTDSQPVCSNLPAGEPIEIQSGDGRASVTALLAAAAVSPGAGRPHSGHYYRPTMVIGPASRREPHRDVCPARTAECCRGWDERRWKMSGGWCSM